MCDPQEHVKNSRLALVDLEDGSKNRTGWEWWSDRLEADIHENRQALRVNLAVNLAFMRVAAADLSTYTGPISTATRSSWGATGGRHRGVATCGTTSSSGNQISARSATTAIPTFCRRQLPADMNLRQPQVQARLGRVSGRPVVQRSGRRRSEHRQLNVWAQGGGKPRHPGLGARQRMLPEGASPQPLCTRHSGFGMKG